ncbi:MAG TPA: PEP-CTERM sorting domain-containing protein [Bryobacteraceae bacterium]|nr:PEP-CTERM sorting domain-containing protein [Bryobacteraceae bacterium]
MRLKQGLLSGLLAVGLAGTAGATVVDLMTLNSSGTLNGGIFVQGGTQPAGTGVFGTFLKYQPGGNQADVQGYNTDGRALQYDEQSAATHTHSLALSDVPLFNCDSSFIPGCVAGEQYRGFELDINAKASDPLLSLDRVVIYDRTAGNLLGGNATEGTPLGGTTLFTGAGDTLVYDSGANNRVDLNYLLESSGSGKSDMFLYVPDTLFTGGSFVYLYSEFGIFEKKKTAAKNEVPCTAGPTPCGGPQDDTSGFEEWGVGAPTGIIRGGGGGPSGGPTVPEPASIVLFGSSLLVVAAWGRKRLVQ